MVVVYALQRLCFGYLVAGDWTGVRSSADEGLALGTGLGQRALTAPPLAWLTLLAALQGRDDYETLLADLDAVVAAHPLGILTDPVHDLTRWAKGARAAAAGDSFGALHHLSRMRLPVLGRMAATERIDAAVRAGQPDQARAWVEELAAFADATGRPWALATVAYGRAMTADPGGDDPADDRREAVRRRPGPPRQCRPVLRPGPHPPRVRRVAAPRPTPARRPRAPAPRAGDVRRPARRATHRTSDRGAARLRRDGPQTGPLHSGQADPDGAQGRPAGLLGPVEQGGRRPDLGLTEDGGVPPPQRLRQGRYHLSRRARPARPRLTPLGRLPAI